MTAQKHVSKGRIATAVATGISAAVLSVYLMSECQISPNYGGPERVTQSSKGRRGPPTHRRPAYEETVNATLRYGEKHSVGGYSLSYEKEGDDIRMHFSEAGGANPNSLRVKALESATVEYQHLGKKLRVTVESADESGVSVSVQVAEVIKPAPPRVEIPPTAQ